MAESRSDPTRELIRAGIFDLNEASKHLAELDKIFATTEEQRSELFTFLQTVEDPDVALTAYIELIHALIKARENQLLDVVGPQSTARNRLLKLLGSSEQLGRMLTTRFDLLKAAIDDEEYDSHSWSLDQRMAAFGAAIGIPTDGSSKSRTTPLPAEFDATLAISALRRQYYRQLVSIATWDVSLDAVSAQPLVSDKLSDLAQAALEAGLAIACAQVPDSAQCRFTVIGMGKLGAHELNYVSDVDLIYVVEPADDEVGLQALLKTGAKLAIKLQKACSEILPGVNEPTLWKIDGALRPEGKDGQLVRRLAAHEEYYKTWAKNWEFQALLKARCVAGDKELGAQYEAMARGFVWTASARQNFVFDCQQMRKRVEDHIPLPLKDREIKLGRGGLRDVEFTVQMLQLVHGRTDETLRSSATLPALKALSDGGYMSRSQAETLGQDYRFERVLEHREQMWKLRRTHLFPDLGEGSTGGLDSTRQVRAAALENNADLRRLARVFDERPEELVARYDATRREVRRLHLDIYYRPMLPQIAQLDNDGISLNENVARQRFESIGFADPDAAILHVRHLTEGISRAAKINRVILPAMLLWLSEGQNPDMGLLTLRKLEESFGHDSEYLGFLRDSPSAGRRLCTVVANSRYLADALTKSVESVTWLGSDDRLAARSRESLDIQCAVSLRRFPSSMGEFATSLRAMRRHEIERIGLSWMSGITKSSQALRAMTDVYDALLQAAFTWSLQREVAQAGLEFSPVRLAFLAMGRYGGREVNFSSDADVVVMYESVNKVDKGEASSARDTSGDAAFARRILDGIRQILGGTISSEPSIDLDFDLRPEGKNGPLIRSYDSFREYYTHWASTWEYQALLRVRYAAGDKELAQRFLTRVADPLRYPDHDLDAKQIQDIRTLKARMEAERLPRGIKRERHLKLGKGGLSDVEWTVQFLQLRHAHEHKELRTVSTVEALRKLRDEKILSPEDAASLESAWKFTTDARNANFLWQGRAERADILPDDSYSLGGISACMRRGSRRGQSFENELLGAMRHCREVTERLFYGNDE